MFRRISMILILIIIILSCSREADEVTAATWEIDKSETTVSVESLTLTKGVLYPTVTSSGIISGIKEAYIISETRGIIEQVNFEIGDKVDSSTVLLSIDDSIARISLTQAAEIYESAKLDLKSTEQFYKKGTASLAQLTRARSSANGAQLQYESALKAVNDNSITTPISGAIAWRDSSITQGNYLNQGQRVAKVVDLSSIRVEVSLGERQIGLVKINSKAKIRLTSITTEKILDATVVAIAAGSDENTGSFRVIVEAPNPLNGTLKAGMSCSVEIETDEKEESYIVPTDSIVERDGKSYLFVERSGIAEPIEVSIIETMGNRTSILIDTEEEESVIISGLNNLKPGVRVEATLLGNSGGWL